MRYCIRNYNKYTVKLTLQFKSTTLLQINLIYLTCWLLKKWLIRVVIILSSMSKAWEARLLSQRIQSSCTIKLFRQISLMSNLSNCKILKKNWMSKSNQSLLAPNSLVDSLNVTKTAKFQNKSFKIVSKLNLNTILISAAWTARVREIKLHHNQITYQSTNLITLSNWANLKSNPYKMCNYQPLSTTRSITLSNSQCRQTLKDSVKIRKMNLEPRLETKSSHGTTKSKV